VSGWNRYAGISMPSTVLLYEIFLKSITPALRAV
jgi:hypothetical protein